MIYRHFFLTKNLILIIATLSLISNYKYFETSKIQTFLLPTTDLLPTTEYYNKRTLIQNEFFYPSLAFNSVPFTTYQSQIYSENQDYESAINLLIKSLELNINCMYSRYLLSRNYVLQKDYSNAEIILEYLFNINPNIEPTSALYLAVLSEMNKKDKLLSLKSTIDKVDNKLISKYYLTALKSDSIKK